MDLLARAAVAQLLEVLAPLRVDALGVGEELFVQGLNVGSVAARERGRGQQLGKAGSHTGKNPCGLKVLEQQRGGMLAEPDHGRKAAMPNLGECYVKERARSPRAARTYPGWHRGPRPRSGRIP